eukprot:525917_1
MLQNDQLSFRSVAHSWQQLQAANSNLLHENTLLKAEIKSLKTENKTIKHRYNELLCNIQNNQQHIIYNPGDYVEFNSDPEDDDIQEHIHVGHIVNIDQTQVVIKLASGQKYTYFVDEIQLTNVNKVKQLMSLHSGDNSLTNDIFSYTKQNQNIHCNDLKNCAALFRLQNAINISKSINKLDIVSVVNDFMHLLTEHDTNDEFEYISDTLGHCNINTCQRFNDNFRNRLNEPIALNSNLQLTTAEYQILNKIHCYFQHCYDIGNNIRNKELQSIHIDEQKETDINPVTNSKIEQIYKLLSQKRNKYKHISAIGHRMKHRCNQLDNDNNREHTQKMYSFGRKIEYQNQRIESILSPSIALAKFKSLKEELLHNTICSIGLSQYENEYQKSEIYFACNYRKTNYKDVNLEYLLSIMIYCNFTELQCIFSATYRVSNFSAHNNFYHLGSNLKHLVHQFGTEIRHGNVKIFYHGINDMLILPAYVSNIYIYGPLSTTSSFAVATNFANCNNGLVIEFQAWYNSQCTYFATAWLSDFGNEQEYFFIQNKHSLYVKNVIDIA